ncbi:MAG: DUF4349 domain-containing protein [Rhodoglobus sp.]
MRRTLTIPAALAVLTMALAGCTASSQGASDSESGGGVVEQMPVGPDGVLDESVDSAQSLVDRQVITTGWVTITVDKPLDAASEAVKITEGSGGRVDGRTEYAPVDGDKGSATLTLRLPADSLTQILDKLKELGTVQEVSLNAADVTMQTQDLDARISALSASVDRLLTLLSSAVDTDTLIQLETAISDRQGELESLESQRRYFADQVALSTVTLNLQSVSTAPVQEPDTFLDGLLAGWNSFIAFFAGLIVVIGVLLPWLVFLGIVLGIVLFVLKRRKSRHPEQLVSAADTTADTASPEPLP